MRKAILVLITLIVLIIFTGVIYASGVKISKETVKQGGFFEITIDGISPKEMFTITFQKRRYRSAPGISTRSHRVLIPVNAFDALGEAEILLESKYKIVIPQKIVIEKADFKKSEIVETIKPLSANELKKYEKEQGILNEIYRKTTKYPFFVTIDEPFFEYPLEEEAEISSPFGFVRQRKIGAKSEKIERVSHGGIDLVVPTGDSVFAVETGIVRLARDLVNSGNTVIIDHGYNVFSVYMHLSQVLVSEGDVVWRSDEIALSGATGRVTGPHLHFGMKIWDTWVNPEYFVRDIGGEK